MLIYLTAFLIAGLATRRLQLIFSQCLIRRKKDSTLEGRKLIELPSKDYFNPEYPFSEEELEIYNFLQARSRVRAWFVLTPSTRTDRLRALQAIFNKFLRQGTVLKNYSQVLVLLLRLRQCCVHPALIGNYFFAGLVELRLISSFAQLNTKMPSCRRGKFASREKMQKT